MPARVRTSQGLAGLVGSDSETDLDSLDRESVLISQTSTKSMAIAKRGRGRGRGRGGHVASGRITKPVAKTTRPVVQRGAANTSARRALTSENTTNAPTEQGEETEQPEQHTTSSPERPKPARGRPKTVTKAAHNVVDGAAARRAASASRSTAQSELEVPETQPVTVDMMLVEEEQEEEAPYAAEEPTLTYGRETPRKSELDLQGSSATIRRRLGDLTKKNEELERRYGDLREIGIKEAEKNYDRLRKQNEDNTAASNELIAKLKAELAAQKALVGQADQVRRELQTSEQNAEELRVEVEDLNRSLTTTRTEVKTLSAKLATSRNAEATLKAPGSALKGSTANARAAAAQAEVFQAAQAKEDLYGDLTGLIVRGHKRGAKEDVFDCIQTGRNGTLHFKLALESAEYADSYEEAQFTYRPQLDESRDEELIDILPDYLIEEITFPRPHASKFYTRVIKSLTEGLES